MADSVRRIGARAAAAAVLCALLASPAAAADLGPAVDGPNRIAVGPSFVAVRDVDPIDANSFAMAYSELEGGNSTLQVGHFNANGQALAAPSLVHSGADAPSWVELLHSSSGADFVVWSLRSAPVVSVVQGGAVVTTATVPIGPLMAEACMASEAGAGIALACEMTPGGVGDVVEVYRFAFDPAAGTFDGPHLISPDDGVASYVLDVAGKEGGSLWVVSADWSPLQEGGNALRMSTINGKTGALSSLQLSTTAGIGGFASTVIQPGGGAIVGFATNVVGNNNAVIQIWSLSADLSLSGLPTLLSGGSGNLQAFGLLGGAAVDGGISVVWAEALEATAGPIRSLGRPYWALIDADLRVIGGARALESSIALPLLRAVDGGFMVSQDLPPTLLWIRPALAQAPPASSSGAFDTTWLVVSLVVAGVGGAAFVGLGGDRARYLAFLILLPLYTALRKERVMLDSMRRGAILQVITESPGVHFRELSRRTRVNRGVLAHHLRVLQEYGFVSRVGSTTTVRFYPLGKNPIEEDPFLVLRRRLVQEIRAMPGISHSALCRRMGMKWSTALYHIDILKEEGRIRARLYRGRRKYWTLE